MARPGPAPSPPRAKRPARRTPPAPILPPRGPSTAAAAEAAAAAKAAETKPKVATSEAAAQIAQAWPDGTKALEALARSVGSEAHPAAPKAPAAAGTLGAAAAGPHAAATSEALQALARAAAEPGAEAARKRAGRMPKGSGLGAHLASAAFEGERRRSSRMHVAGDAAAARKAMDQAAREMPSAASPTPLSEGERHAARRQRTDLVITWAVAAVVSTGLTLAAYLSGVPDIGLGSLLFLGLAGARTWWLTRSKGGDTRL